MKFMIRLFKVLICVVLFLLISYFIEERDSIFKLDNSNSNTDQSVHETPSNEMVNHSVSDSDDEEIATKNEEVLDEPLEKIKEDHESQNETIVEKNEEAKLYNFNMEAIDKHSIGHLNDMKEVIQSYKDAPHDDIDNLYKMLYTRNFMHLEEELEEKNKGLYDALVDLLEPLKEKSVTDSETVIKILDQIQVILDGILKVE